MALPTLLMSGERSRRSALAVADVLASIWPQATTARFTRVGHLGPMTHAPVVNEAIAQHLDFVVNAGRTRPKSARASVIHMHDGLISRGRRAGTRARALRAERMPPPNPS
jgi:hypothetical protein